MHTEFVLLRLRSRHFTNKPVVCIEGSGGIVFAIKKPAKCLFKRVTA